MIIIYAILDVAPIRYSSQDLDPDCTGPLYSMPYKFFCIQYNQTLTKCCFKPYEEVNSSMGVSPILHEAVLASHVETALLRVKVMLRARFTIVGVPGQSLKWGPLPIAIFLEYTCDFI